ncbi:MAG: hypothetical protein A2857_04795 [Candidatus Levybacteria bacterium RIFCSPHIGHO2_01_FULL_36_15]|nr:MAG: hypothetical protein A2857_04795 [Candidatus Levybacteria bacterium RIFCSPHIGHO2_01_FULL_36_15]OGH38588.1 MAG: hypothetical protein A2905_04100 [Candidatus Levybacteria bacterium RIFCSPLOWO2_01_FULL_36_10]
MNKNVCEVCKKVRAKKLIKIVDNNQLQVIQVCEKDYINLKHPENTSNTNLFSSNQESEFLINLYDSNVAFSDHKLTTININETLSEETKLIIQDSARIAIELNHNEIRLEHVLYSLVDNRQIKDVLEKFNVKPNDIKEHIEIFAPRGNNSYSKIDEINLEFSENLKTIFENAYEITRESGSKYIEPIYLFICIAQKKSLASDILKTFNSDFIEQVNKFIAKDAILAKQLKLTTLAQLDKIKLCAKTKLNIDIIFDNSVVDYLMEVDLLPKLDITEIDEKIKERIEYVLVKEVLQGYVNRNDIIIINFDRSTHEIVFAKKTTNISKT